MPLYTPGEALLVSDDMSITSLTRFTQLADSGVAQTTPTIASNLLTLAMAAGSGNQNNTLQEGADILRSQFFSSINVASVTHSGADTNAAENISIGLCKSANPGDFIFALWQRKTGTYGTVSIQAKIAGAQNLRSAVTLAAAWTPPFDFGISCFVNSINLWQKPNGGSWTMIASWALTEIDLYAGSLTGWKPGFRVTATPTAQVTFNLTNFKFGSLRQWLTTT